MAEKIYNKLVRDKIAEIITSEGNTAITRTLTDGEHLRALKEKLIEEASELLVADTKEDMASELADIWEVINKIIEIERLPHDQIEKTRQQKLADRGGFDSKLFLEKVIEN